MEQSNRWYDQYRSKFNAVFNPLREKNKGRDSHFGEGARYRPYSRIVQQLNTFCNWIWFVFKFTSANIRVITIVYREINCRIMFQSCASTLKALLVFLLVTCYRSISSRTRIYDVLLSMNQKGILCFSQIQLHLSRARQGNITANEKQSFKRRYKLWTS